MFFSDLVKKLSFKPEIDFVRIASYGHDSSRAETILFTKDIEISIENKHVLVVEDIVDTGHSMSYFFNRLINNGAKSLRLATLVDKYERREVEINVDFRCFSVPDGFIVGYGLDYAENYRELPALYIADV